jgi:hypothetical protein
MTSTQKHVEGADTGRQRNPLFSVLIGLAALAVLLVVEVYLGGLIRDKGQDGLTAVHIPLAMALMALVVCLSLRATRREVR